MSYIINNSRGEVIAVVADGTINTSSSMTLVGKNYAGYGQFLDTNFIHLLENSSNTDETFIVHLDEFHLFFSNDKLSEEYIPQHFLAFSNTYPLYETLDL